MHYHLILTQRCNLSCTYCGQEVDLNVMAQDMNFSIDKLKNFIEKDKDAVLAFYGGEPLLELDKIETIMTELNKIVKAFVIQTNGTRLHRLPVHLVKQFHTILISVDGDADLTNFFRGEKTYERAIRGGIYARKSGFTGDLVARMSVTRKTDIFQAVTHLLFLDNLDFNHVHWQLDAMWGDAFEKELDEFEQWVDNSYNSGITKLIEMWLDKMKEGTLLGIAPFLGIMYSILTETKSPLRCGAGLDFFAITTDGRITACPIPPSLVFPVLGTIETKPEDLPNKLLIGGKCLSCEYNSLCGGRCLYTNKTMHWGERGFDLTCKTVKHLIDELKRISPEVQQLVSEGKYSVSDFNYPEMPNGVEVIP